MGERRSKRPGKIKKALRQGVSTVVRLATMGQSQSHDLLPLTANTNPDAPPLRFHRTTHGDNIRLESEGARARRVESFCNGVLFSDRPVAVGERVCLRICELSSRWSGVIRIGFSTHDPSHLGRLPKYACPDLTSMPGYWAKALSERYSETSVLIHYSVSGNGDVYFGVNGRDRGVFFSGVDTRRPLWAMIDLYGNCTGIELVDLRKNLNNFTQAAYHRQQSRLTAMPTASLATDGGERRIEAVNDQLSTLVIENPEPPPPRYIPPPTQRCRPDFLPLNFNQGISFRPQSFHFCTGKNSSLSDVSTVATRHEEEFAQGYVFSACQIKLGERLVVQVLGTEDSYIGSLAFGLTNCDPSSIDTRELPEDSDLLLDRPEYWVVSKDVANSPGVGDELSFTVKLDGTVEFSKNGNIPSVFMHVDTSLRLWAFWDIYGNTSKIRILGSTILPVVRCQTAAEAPLVAVASTPGPVPEQPFDPEHQRECIVCLEKPIDCVIYACGHMAMCHGCAVQQWKGRGGGFCPICRENIRDVIKTFRS